MLRAHKILISPAWKSLLRAQRLDSLQAVYDFDRGEIVTRSGTTEVRRIVFPGAGNARTVYLKKYWANTARQVWSGALRGTLLGRSKARREFENLARLRRWGLDAPAPVAYGEHRRGLWLVRSFLMSEEIPDPMPLDVFIRDELPRAPETERRGLRRELLERLADYTGRLHEQRFVHHDFFWRNIILSSQSLENFSLIDAHKGRRWLPWAERRSRAKDLAALDSPAPHFFRRTERLRFFLRYTAHAKLSEADKKLIRLVLKFAEPLRARQLRRVREGRRVQA